MALYCRWVGPLLLALGQEARLAAAAARYIRLFSGAGGLEEPGAAAGVQQGCRGARLHLAPLQLESAQLWLTQPPLTPVFVPDLFPAPAATIPLHAVSLCCYRTLAAQGAAGHLLAAGAAFCASTPILNWLLIFRLGLGLDGSALAAVACEVVNVSVLAAACWAHNAARPPERRWWHGWSAAALAHGWGPFLRLSLAATLMITLDWRAAAASHCCCRRCRRCRCCCTCLHVAAQAGAYRPAWLPASHTTVLACPATCNAPFRSPTAGGSTTC